MDTSTVDPEHFWGKVNRRTDGCWQWTGTISGKQRNAMYSFQRDGGPRIRRSAQAVAWELTSGLAAPAGAFVVNTCLDRSCVRPDHLELRDSTGVAAHHEAERADRFWNRMTRPDDGCWEWQGPRDHAGIGYGIAHWANKPIGAHRLAYTLTHGPIPPGMFVCHRCDNPRCCNPAHLFLGEPAENSADMAAKGRSHRATGPASNRAKLTADQVRAIRAEYAAGGTSMHRLAASYDVTAMAIHGVVRRRTYTDVD